MQKTKLVGLTFGLSLLGCGGGTTAAENTAEEAAGPVTAGGEVVTEEAQARWSDAIQFFAAAEADGFTAEECTRAGTMFEQANASQSGRFTEAIYMIGLVHERCGNSEQAQVQYRRALETNDHFCGARVAAGIEHYRAGRVDQARSEWQRATTDDPRGCAEGYLNLSMLQRRNPGQAAEALQNIRRALAIDASYLPAFNHLALLYYEQALRGAEQTGVAGGTARQAGAEGAVRVDRRLLDLAEVVCRQAQLLNANYAPIYNTWGLIKVQQGNVSEALRFFQRAIELNGDFYEAHMNFGQVTLSFRGYEDANRSFAAAVRLRPDSYDALLGLGAALRGLRQVDGAQATYERAIALDAGRPEAYFNTGLLWQDYRGGSDEDFARARGYYDQFLSRARSRAGLESTVQAVERRCAAQPQSGRRRRVRRTDCDMGRLQQMEEAMTLRRELAQMQSAAAPSAEAPAAAPAAPAE